MVQKLTENIDRKLSKVVEAGSLAEGSNTHGKAAEANSNTILTRPDPQVSSTKQTSPRRIFTCQEKIKILETYEACKTMEERGELLRSCYAVLTKH